MSEIQASPNLSDRTQTIQSEIDLYLRHVVNGQSIRSLARQIGVHPSTVLRRVRKLETRRDDPLIDQALEGMGRKNSANDTKMDQSMTEDITHDFAAQKQDLKPKDSIRYLKRLNEHGAFLALASDMENAVILRPTADGQTVRSAVIGRADVQVLALNDWITPIKKSRVSRYAITAAGRKALKRLIAGHAMPMPQNQRQNIFAEQHREWGERNEISETSGRIRKRRVNLADSPLGLLSRRKGRDGQPFLSADLVSCGEQLREDFELSHIGPSITQNWERFLTGPSSSFISDNSGGSSSASKRFRAAIEALWPGLSEVALHCCCFQEGMETTEKRMGWSARSGKIVLRIALQRLKLHYEGTYGDHGPMIG